VPKAVTLMLNSTAFKTLAGTVGYAAVPPGLHTSTAETFAFPS